MGHYNSLQIAIRTELSQRITRKEELMIILDFAEEISGSILEIGCNLGYLAGVISEDKRKKLVVGIDSNESAAVRRLAIWRNRKRRTRFLYAIDGRKLPFKDVGFDGVILSHVLEHFENPSEILREIRRIMKKDGRLIVAVPKEEFLGELTPDHKILFQSLGDLMKILKKNGFRIERAREIKKAIIAIAEME